MVLEPVLCVFRKSTCFSDEHSLGVEVNPVESNSVLALLACNLLQIKKNARFSQFLGNFPLSHDMLFLLQGDRREPPGICTKTLVNSTYPEPIFFHKIKSYHCPSPGGITGKDSQSNVISCIIFNKSLTIIYIVSKNS